MDCSDDFNNSPLLIPSDTKRLPEVLDHGVKSCAGTWKQGDAFYLVTDAVAAWFLRQHEHGVKPWQTLDGFDQEDKHPLFERWVQDLRLRKKMKNDDATVLRLAISYVG